MPSLSSCFFILGWFWCLWTQKAADRHMVAKGCAGLPSFSPFSWDTFPDRPGPLWMSECRLQEGLGLLRQKQHRRRGRKPSPFPHMALIPKERLPLFFPFQKDTRQGNTSGKWKTEAVLLCVWSGMITERKDKRTFSEHKGHCQSYRKGGSISPLRDYIKGRREKK